MGDASVTGICDNCQRACIKGVLMNDCVSIINQRNNFLCRETPGPTIAGAGVS